MDLLDSRQSKINLVLSLFSLNCRLRPLEYFFWVILEKRHGFLSSSCFSYLSNASTRLFWHVKYYLNLKTFRHFKMQKEKLCNDDVNRVCPLIDHRGDPIKMREWLELLYIFSCYKEITTDKDFYFKIFQITRTSLPTLTNTKMAIWRNLLYTKWSNLIGYYA